VSGITVTPAIGSSDFSVVTFPVTAGANARVRISMQTNGSGEFFAIDSVCFLGDEAVTAAPELAGMPVDDLDYTEGDAATALAPAITVTDADSVTLTSATVNIGTGFNAAEDVLAATSSGALTAGDISFAGNVLTISGTASLADYEAVLQSVTYFNTNSTNPDSASRTVSFQVSDGSNDSVPSFRTINVSNLFDIRGIPFSESFETDGQGVRYFAEGQFGGPSDSDVFGRVNAMAAGVDGSFAFAVEDIETIDPLEAIYFNVDGGGFTNLKLNLLVAAPNVTGYDTGDFVEAEVSTDGLSWTTVGAFHAISDGSTAAVGNVGLSQDLNFDGLGDTDSTVLTAGFQDFEFDLPELADFQLRVVMQSNTNSERIAIDNVRVTADPVEFSIAAATASESASEVALTVTRTSDAGEATVDYSTSDGTATSSSDYTAVSGGTVTFEDGETTADISITVSDESLVELDEDFSVTLSNPSAGEIATGEGTATGTISNDDSALVSVSGSSVTEGDSGTADLTFTVTLSNSVDTAVELSVATTTSGGATPGTDFTALAATSLSFASGETSKSFDVVVTSDNDVESDESVGVAVAITNAAGRAVSGGTLTTTGTITDDDPEIVLTSSGLSYQPGLSSKISIADLLTNASGGEGRPLSLVSVSSTAGAGQGSSVAIVNNHIIYTAAPGQTSLDSFTYQISDGFQTVTGTINVFNAGNGNSATSNIVSLDVTLEENIIRAAGIPGRSYQLQSSGDMVNWGDEGASIVCPPGGVMTFTDPGPNASTLLYRVVDPSNVIAPPA
jgi:hypothetical protein